MSQTMPRPVGSPDDIIVYDGRPHSRYYAMAAFRAAKVPPAWIERAMAEAKVLFAQTSEKNPVIVEFGDWKPCHDEKGLFAPCGSEAAERGEKAKKERAEKKEKEKADRPNRPGTKEYREKHREALKSVAAEVRSIRKEKGFPPPTGTEVYSGPPTPQRSRVGVPGDSVPPPPRIPRLPNLTADERYAEDRFATEFERNPDKVAGDYMKDVEKEYEKAMKEGREKLAAKGKNPDDFATCRVFETDAAKSLSGDYNPQGVSKQENLDAKGRYNAAVHQTANAIVKKAFVKYLDEIAKGPEDKKRVLVTSGGCGSGKGYAVGNVLGNVMGKVGATWDAAGEQNATENQWIMDECKKRGIRPTYVFVHADPTTSWEDPVGGVIQRAKGKGRMVDARLFAESYTEGAKNFKAFMDKHKDGGEADFVCIDNSIRAVDSAGKAIPPKALDGFPPAALKFDADKLTARSANYVAKVADLSPALRRGAMIGGRVWGNAKKASTGKKKAA